MNFYRLSISTVNQNILYLFWIILKWRIQGKVIMVCQRNENGVGKASFGIGRLPAMATIAPSLILNDVSGISNSGENSILKPRPLHTGQAPNGLLKEKLLGSISSRLTPQSGQEKL